MDVYDVYMEWEHDQCVLDEHDECSNCGQCCQDDDDLCVDQTKLLIGI